MKEKVHHACLSMVKDKISQLQQTINDAQKAASEDTKSSAGDKFETSREMLKQEIDKHTSQLVRSNRMLKHLQQLNPQKHENTITHGSLAYTNEGIYYFSVSLGKIAFEGESYYMLSMASPVGRALQGKRVGDIVNFRNRSIKIEKVM